MDESPNRMLAAIMFTDMVGYTALMQENELRAKTLRDRFRRVLRQYFDQHGGRALQFYGDGALCSFTSAIEAVVCARKIHKALRTDPKVPVRTGIHEGDVVFEKDGIYGDGVNVAARIEQLAPPGGICISEKVYDEITNQPGMDAISLGRVSLRNVKRPIEIFALMGADLAAPTSGTMARSDAAPSFLPVDKTRLAVLPLVNFSSETDQYFSDGMTEELISRLSQINGLRVIARTSVMQYKDTKKPIVRIGRELNVGTVLEGSVRKSGDKLRVTVQLIDAASEEHIWSHDYDRENNDVFSIQSDIAHHCAEMLRLRLLSGEQHRIDKKGTENLEAFNLYLKGRYYWNMRTGEGLEKSVMNFNLAIEEDPAYALAYAGLADAYILLAGYGHAPPEQALSKASQAARKAVELDDMLAESHTSLAGTVFHYFEWATVERELQRAIKLNPSYVTSHHWYAVALAAMGRLDEAIAREDQALDLDPLNLVINTYKGWIYYLARKYDQALEQYWSTIELNPQFYLPYLWMGQAYGQMGLHEGAIGAIQKAVNLSGGSTMAKAVFGHTLADSGSKPEAEKIVTELITLSAERYVPSYFIAAIYAGLDDDDEAFKWLNKACAEHYMFFNWLNVEPIFDGLRADERFGELLKTMGLSK